MLNSSLKALSRRLAKSTLTEEDKKQLAFVRRLVGLKREGATLLEMARETGETEPKIRQFMQRGVYKLYRDYVLQLEVGDNDKQVATIVKDAKHRFAQFAPDAMDFYAYAFERNKEDDVREKGPFKQADLAQWATEKVSKGLGLDQPEHAIRPVIHIDLKLIHAENSMVDSDDARAAAAIDVTPKKLEHETPEAD